jgi:protein TonB
MSAGDRPPQPKSREWLHSGPYFLIALALHGLVLLYPLALNVDQPAPTPPTPVQVMFAEKVSPVAASLPPPKPVAQKPAHREKPAPQTIIAVAPTPGSAPATFTVPAPAPVLAPPAAQAVPAASNTAAQPTFTAARFDAAYLQNPHPEYPTISRRLGEEGRVLLRVRVTADGRAAAVDVDKSSSFTRLDDAALRGVARWRFVPARRGDEAVEATVIVPIVFRLDN